MRARPAAFCILVLTASRVGGAEAAEPRHRRPPRAPGDEIDLGTATLGHREVGLGPFGAAIGGFDRVQIGTRTLPWFVGLVAPGSIVPNGYVKVRLLTLGPWSMAVESALFYARLRNLAGDGVNLRAWIWPTRALLERQITRRWAVNLELTGVFSEVAGSALIDTDTSVEGVALARTVYAGVLPRYRLKPWISLWGRVRVLVGHSPVVARAESQLSERTRMEVEVRADAAELSSGAAAVAGVHLHGSWVSFNLAAGYGTWFIPWFYLPVTQGTFIGEVDLTFRF
jgi:hypothetical protein